MQAAVGHLRGMVQTAASAYQHSPTFRSWRHGMQTITKCRLLEVAAGRKIDAYVRCAGWRAIDFETRRGGLESGQGDTHVPSHRGREGVSGARKYSQVLTMVMPRRWRRGRYTVGPYCGHHATRESQ
jgi:hypothetical protein